MVEKCTKGTLVKLSAHSKYVGISDLLVFFNLSATSTLEITYQLKLNCLENDLKQNG